jgi:hypothetical protein
VEKELKKKAAEEEERLRKEMEVRLHVGNIWEL